MEQKAEKTIDEKIQEARAKREAMERARQEREDAAAKRKLDHIISALRFAREPDRLALLRILLEAKDCAVRAALVRRREVETHPGAQRTPPSS